MVITPELQADEGTGTRASGWDDDAPTSCLNLPAQSPASPDPVPEPAAGSVLRGRFVLEQVIGRGGTSIIYRARDLHRALPQEMASSSVAIKVLRAEQRDDPLVLTLLQREFQQMQSLSHPGIARVFDLDCDGDVWFMIMELVTGRTLRAWVQSYDSHDDALSIIVRCGEALAHAHSLGIVHGDLKPTNVMITSDGSAKLIDFGSAPSPGALVAAGARPILGITPLYASPQVLAGQTADPRDDVYSFACLSYYVLSSGRHPFGGHPVLEDGRAKSAPDHVRTLPAELFAVIERGLSLERDRRHASVREYLQALTEAAQQRAQAISTRPQTLPQWKQAAAPRRAAPGRARQSWLAAPLVAFASIGAGMVGLVSWLRPGTEPAAPLALVKPVSVPHPFPATPEPAHVATARVLPPVGRAVPPASRSVSFQSPSIRASALQSLVAIPVTRPTSKGTAAFVWRVERGSAQEDVDTPQGEPQVVRFNDGQSVRTLFVPLTRHSAGTSERDPRTFAVALERVAGGPALGDIPRITVVIDPLPPAVSRRAPLYQAALPALTPLTNCRQRAPLRLACLFSWRPRMGGRTLED